MKHVAKIFGFGILTSCLLMALVAAPLTGCCCRKCGPTKDHQGKNANDPAEQKASLPNPPFMGGKLCPVVRWFYRGDPGVAKIHWETQSEQNVFGFIIKRSDSEKGTYAQINAKPILGAGNSSTLMPYTYYDKDVKVGKTYYYYIETININGQVDNKSIVLKNLVSHRYFKSKDR